MLIIFASHYAQLAQINFGIVSCCLSVSAPLNCLLSYIFWKERLSCKMIIGTLVIVTGVAWIALAKGQTAPPIAIDGVETIDEGEKNQYRIMSIACALLSGCLGSTRILQAKYVNLRLKYSPMEFSNDAGLFCGVVIFIISVYYYIQGHPSYTWYNFGICFIASVFQMLTSLVGLNCVVKGLGGPTSAILQTQSVVGTVLNAIFLGLIPTIFQLMGSLIALSGVIIIMIFK